MSLKRSYPAAGGPAYGDGLLPPKVAAVPQSWQDYSQVGTGRLQRTHYSAMVTVQQLQHTH